ncbi:MAG: uroporphyrinogen decarboxylase [Anaerolineales bacterium]|nr:uroporphyrinogen decarboxylase [Anaerolineales bacterium]
MEKRERLFAAFDRQPVDRPPVALWRHFPGDDLDPDRFAERIVNFQRVFDFDFVKVTPAGSYSAEMYGGRLAPDAGNIEGARTHVVRVVNEWQDWDRIEALDVDNLVFRRESASIARIRAALGPNVPIAQTLFSPLSIASRLAGSRFETDLVEHPDAVKRALERITLTVLRFAREASAAGADAYFLAVQMGSRQFLTPEQLNRFAVPYDLALLEAVRPHAGFVFLHIHGDDIYFDELAAYPVEVVNWHDRKTPPSLGDGKRLVLGAVAGGLDEMGVLRHGTPAGSSGAGGGCDPPDGWSRRDHLGRMWTAIDTPQENLYAARRAVELL